MADNVYLPGGILSLATGAADRLIASGSGDAALLYLYLLKTGGAYDSAQAARALRWEPSRADAALSLLSGMALATDKPPAPAPKTLPEPPEYSSADINRELENKEASFPALVQ